jgi:hypothetical protein
MNLKTLTTPKVHTVGLGFILQAQRNATSPEEALERMVHQDTADRLNGLLDSYQAMCSKLAALDEQPRADFNDQPGQVAAVVALGERFGNDTDPTVAGYVAFTGDQIQSADLKLGSRRVFRASEGQFELYSPQDDATYLLAPGTSAGLLEVTRKSSTPGVIPL